MILVLLVALGVILGGLVLSALRAHGSPLAVLDRELKRYAQEREFLERQAKEHAREAQRWWTKERTENEAIQWADVVRESGVIAAYDASMPERERHRAVRFIGLCALLGFVILLRLLVWALLSTVATREASMSMWAAFWLLFIIWWIAPEMVGKRFELLGRRAIATVHRCRR
jgi:hypothetical protein